MSVHVEINIAGGTARRHLHIFRTDPVAGKMDPHGFRSLDDVSNYRVEVEGGRGRDYSQAAEFHHRYGDSELTLVGEAIFALLGHLPQQDKPVIDQA